MPSPPPSTDPTVSVFEPLLQQRFEVFPPRQAVTTRAAGLNPDLTTAISHAGGWSETPVTLELLEVTRHPRMKRPRRNEADQPLEAFVLLFRGSAAPGEALASSSHLVRHPAVGELVVFLSPVVLPPDGASNGESPGRHYEAVFA
jgi:hypothetical protein